jgi:hypothetical protein
LFETIGSIMARSFPFLMEGGPQPAFTSPVRAKGRAVMYDQYLRSKYVPSHNRQDQNLSGAAAMPTKGPRLG